MIRKCEKALFFNYSGTLIDPVQEHRNSSISELFEHFIVRSNKDHQVCRCWCWEEVDYIST